MMLWGVNSGAYRYSTVGFTGQPDGRGIRGQPVGIACFTAERIIAISVPEPGPGMEETTYGS